MVEARRAIKPATRGELTIEQDQRWFCAHVLGEIPKRLNGADCKSAGLWPTEVRILLSPPAPSRAMSHLVGDWGTSNECWERVGRWSDARRWGQREEGRRGWMAGRTHFGVERPAGLTRIRDIGRHGTKELNAGIAQLARAPAFQAGGRGFESRFPLQHSMGKIRKASGEARERKELTGLAHLAQVVEHVLGKDEVSGSSHLVSSRECRDRE